MDDSRGLENYLRLTILLSQGTEILRELFRSRYEQVSGKKWEDGSKFGSKFISGLARNVYKQAQKIQKEMLSSGNINEWDLALLAQLLTRTTIFLCPTIDKEKGVEKNENENELDIIESKKQNVAITQLLQVRNAVAHLADKFLCTDDFTNLWHLTTGSLIDLGHSAEELESLKSAEHIGNIQFPLSENSSQDQMKKSQKFREQGNKALQSNNFNKAIRLYSEALILPKISAIEKSILLSNRSYAHLQTLNNTHCQEEIQSTCTLAFEDCQLAIDLRPSWWKGYYRAGQIYRRLKQWKCAVINFNLALILNPSDEQVKKYRDECRIDLRLECAEQHLDAYTRPHSITEEIEKQQKERGGLENVTADFLAKQCEKLMESKDPKVAALACVYFGHHHWQGVDAPVDYKKAASLFAKAAEAGNTEGMFKLGLLYQIGKGVERDLNKAIEFFELAARQPINDPINGLPNIGVAESQYTLGMCYEEGSGKPLDIGKAVKWYERATINGSGLAPYCLGHLYSRGFEGIERSQEKAIQYYTMAATKRVSYAMSSLAWIYLSIDVDQAQIWYDRSINAGNLNSLLNKQSFEEALELQRSTLQKDESCEILNNNQMDSAMELKLKSPQRQFIVNTHRSKWVKEITKLNLHNVENSSFVTNISMLNNPLHKHEAPSDTSNLTEITLDEMNPLEDHVYSGFIIKFTIMEDSRFGIYESVPTVVRDAKGQFQICYFGNVDQTDRDVKRKFSFGSTLSIINPYFRLCVDGSVGIRVDDPKAIIFHTNGIDEPKCRFCGRLYPSKTCVKCHRAKYCDRVCQIDDWNILLHKLICDPKFSLLV